MVEIKPIKEKVELNISDVKKLAIIPNYPKEGIHVKFIGDQGGVLYEMNMVDSIVTLVPSLTNVDRLGQKDTAIDIDFVDTASCKVISEEYGLGVPLRKVVCDREFKKGY